MTMFRIQKDKDNPYVMLNKQFLNDDRLSWKAKGLLSYLLSLPDDWQIYENEVTGHSSDGIKSTNSGIKELIKYGYIHRIQTRGERGKFGSYEYCVYEVPTESTKTANGETENGKTENGKRQTTNNNLTNNDLTDNNKTNITYINLPIDGEYLGIYNQYFFNKFNKNHMKISEQSLNTIMQCLEELDFVDIESWEECVKEHFEKLPKANDGNVLAFLRASKRYFEHDLKEHFDGYIKVDKSSRFNNYGQRDYKKSDFKNIERKILGW